MLGSGLNKWQFCVPRENSKRAGEETVIGTVNMENTKSRTIIENIESLIDIVLPPKENERKEKWVQAVSHYRGSFCARKKEITQNLNYKTRNILVFLEIYGYISIKSVK